MIRKNNRSSHFYNYCGYNMSQSVEGVLIGQNVVPFYGSVSDDFLNVVDNHLFGNPKGHKRQQNQND